MSGSRLSKVEKDVEDASRKEEKMTTLEIAYQTFLESARHNLVDEGIRQQLANETGRHNLVVEDQGQQSINEAVRHNKTTEEQNQFQITENARHNRVSEMIGFKQAAAQQLAASAAYRQSTAALSNAQTNFLMYGMQSSVQNRLANAAERKAAAYESNAKANLANMRINQGYFEEQVRMDKISNYFGLFDRVSGTVNNVGNLVQMLPGAARKIGF
jgi:hypothetical protein